MFRSMSFYHSINQSFIKRNIPLSTKFTCVSECKCCPLNDLLVWVACIARAMASEWETPLLQSIPQSYEHSWWIKRAMKSTRSVPWNGGFTNRQKRSKASCCMASRKNLFWKYFSWRSSHACVAEKNWFSVSNSHTQALINLCINDHQLTSWYTSVWTNLLHSELKSV